MLDPAAPQHWAKAEILRHGPVIPLDTLKAVHLAPLRRVAMAQPRPLSPDENVALDAWVRGGGNLLLFADPMLTENSAFALGDKRRPNDLVQLSPILAHWGLSLEFDENQMATESRMHALGIEVPVNLPGRLLVSDPAHCRSWGDGNILATCRIGKGRVMVLADAAVLERDDPDSQRVRALAALLSAAFLAD